jgi:bacteriocin-like protein
MPSKPKKTTSKKPAVKGKPTKGGKELTDKDLELIAGGTRPAQAPVRKKPWVF